MKRLDYYFIVGYALMLLLCSIFMLIGLMTDIPYFNNISSIYTNAKIYFLSSLILGCIGFYLFGKHLKNYCFSIGTTIILGTILYVSLTYSLDNILNMNYIVNHIIAFLLTSILAFYIGYIFLISKLNFKLQNVFCLICIFYLVISFSYGNVNISNHIFLPITTLNN